MNGPDLNHTLLNTTCQVIKRISNLSFTLNTEHKYTLHLKSKCEKETLTPILTQYSPCLKLTSIWERWGWRSSSLYVKISQYKSSSSHDIFYCPLDKSWSKHRPIYVPPGLWITGYQKIAEWEGISEPIYLPPAKCYRTPLHWPTQDQANTLLRIWGKRGSFHKASHCASWVALGIVIPFNSEVISTHGFQIFPQQLSQCLPY